MCVIARLPARYVSFVVGSVVNRSLTNIQNTHENWVLCIYENQLKILVLIMSISSAIHSFIQSYIHKFIHSFVNSYIHSFIYSFIHLFFQFFGQSIDRSIDRSIVRSNWRCIKFTLPLFLSKVGAKKKSSLSHSYCSHSFFSLLICVCMWINMSILILLLLWPYSSVQIAILLPIEISTQREKYYLLQQVTNYLIKSN